MAVRRRRAAPRLRPLLLSKLIGPRALRPPPADLEPPAPRELPVLDARGLPIPPVFAPLEALDDLDPASLPRDRRAAAHWDGDDWHDGETRGLRRDGGWLPLRRDKGRWWAFAGESGNAQLRHDGVWWTKERGIWFVVHDGRPWAWRPFQDWGAEGLFQPGTGVEMVYSRDFKRVAVIAPGEETAVFDAETGAELARVPERRMPARRRPRPAPVLDPTANVFDG
jgi:hypothetical protein